MLIAILLSSFKSFSQTIILTEKQAKAVAKDIVEGKACKEELEQTKSVLELTETKVKLKDKVIQNLEKQKSELNAKDLLRLEQIDSKDKIISDTEKQVKDANRKSTFYKIVALAGALLSGSLLLIP